MLPLPHRMPVHCFKLLLKIFAKFNNGLLKVTNFDALYIQMGSNIKPGAIKVLEAGW